MVLFDVYKKLSTIFPNIFSKTYLYSFAHFLLLALGFLLLLFVLLCRLLLGLSLLYSHKFLLGLGYVLLLLYYFLYLLSVVIYLLVYEHLLCVALLLARLKYIMFFLLVFLIVLLLILHVALLHQIRL